MLLQNIFTHQLTESSNPLHPVPKEDFSLSFQVEETEAQKEETVFLMSHTFKFYFII